MSHTILDFATARDTVDSWYSYDMQSSTAKDINKLLSQLSSPIILVFDQSCLPIARETPSAPPIFRVLFYLCMRPWLRTTKFDVATVTGRGLVL